MNYANPQSGRRTAWNKGKLVGSKPPLKLKEIWAIRVRPELLVTHYSRAPDFAQHAPKIPSQIRLHVILRPAAAQQPSRDNRKVSLSVDALGIGRSGRLTKDLAIFQDGIPGARTVWAGMHLPLLADGGKVGAEANVLNTRDLNDVLNVSEVVIERGRGF